VGVERGDLGVDVRSASTLPVADFAAPLARPDRAALAASMASS
jgi:hypothetical protein